jgi:hypothetical protein
MSCGLWKHDSRCLGSVVDNAITPDQQYPLPIFFYNFILSHPRKRLVKEFLLIYCLRRVIQLCVALETRLDMRVLSFH